MSIHIVTRQIPSYLRLHQTDTPLNRQTPDAANEVASFWQTYTEATGWQLDQRRRGGGSLRLLPAVDVDLMAGVDEYLESPAVSQTSAEELAIAAGKIHSRLHDAMQTIRLQDAELTAKAGKMMPLQRRVEFADKLEAILSDALVATGCDAAALYLMDEDTTELRLRAQVGLPDSRSTEAARPMRGALADLEALVKGVMSVDSFTSLEGEMWNSPEPFTSGICASVGEDDLPLGTLWLWSEKENRFEDSHRAAARLAASNMISEIARENITRSETKLRKATETVKAVSAWQERQLPLAMPLAEDWVADGWTESAMMLAKSWFTWDILPDGTIAAVVAEASSKSLDGAMIAATARASFQSHSGYPLRPRQMLQRIADTLWQTNSGEQLVSLLYARIDPETGEGAVASAGNIQGLVCSRYGFRPLNSVSDPLGARLDFAPSESSIHLLAGETLFACTAGLIGTAGDPKGSRFSQQQLAGLISESLAKGPAGIMPALRRGLSGPPLDSDRTALLLSRQ